MNINYDRLDRSFTITDDDGRILWAKDIVLAQKVLKNQFQLTTSQAHEAVLQAVFGDGRDIDLATIKLIALTQNDVLSLVEKTDAYRNVKPENVSDESMANSLTELGKLVAALSTEVASTAAQLKTNISKMSSEEKIDSARTFEGLKEVLQAFGQALASLV